MCVVCCEPGGGGWGWTRSSSSSSRSGMLEPGVGHLLGGLVNICFHCAVFPQRRQSDVPPIKKKLKSLKIMQQEKIKPQLTECWCGGSQSCRRRFIFITPTDSITSHHIQLWTGPEPLQVPDQWASFLHLCFCDWSSVFYYSSCFNYILKLILHQFIIEGSNYI